MVGRPKFVLYNRLLQPKIRTSLTYCDTKTLTASTGSVGHWFKLSDIHDPDHTGVGHQPAFHDEWANIYTKYRVIACQWIVKFTPNRNSKHVIAATTEAVVDTNHNDMSYNPAIVAVEVADSSTSTYTEPGDKNFIRETAHGQKNVKYKVTGPNPNKSYYLRGTTFLKNIYDDPNHGNASTLIGTSPNNNVFIRVAKMSKDGTEASQYEVDVRFKFLVEFSDPLNVNQS